MRNSVFLLACVFILLSTPPADGWKETMHESKLTLDALEVVRLANRDGRYPAEVYEDYGRLVMLGAQDEDWPVRIEAQWAAMPVRLLCRANNHYRHAISGRGLTEVAVFDTGDPDVDAMNWALTNPHFDAREEFDGGRKWRLRALGLTSRDVSFGNMSWQQCINRFGYTPDAKKLAYYTLGFVLHLLQDMGCPEHVHDDPHASSGEIGFEKYVEANWRRIRPPLRSLRPRELSDIETYFDRLAKIGYSANRFQGWNPGTDATPRIEADSDLAKMFRVKRGTERLAPPPVFNRELTTDRSEKVHRVVYLENPGSNRRILNLPARHDISFRWYPDDFGRGPHHAKTEDLGYLEGHFWPTCQELNHVKGNPRNDAPGFFYVELSDDVPPNWGTRSLYPHAYLPTPLREVAGECRGWRERLDGNTHLYEVMGRKVFPHVITYSAGLIQHYLSLVNHPPFVRQVEVSLKGVLEPLLSYRGRCVDRIGRRHGTDTIREVSTRDLIVESNEPCTPGTNLIRVTFSEPVDKANVHVANSRIRVRSQDGGLTWEGSFRIGMSGSREEVASIWISATDRHAHHGDVGGQLDTVPETPARRRAAAQVRKARGGGVRTTMRYGWQGYEPGIDKNHQIRIRRDRLLEPLFPDEAPAAGTRDLGWEGSWTVTSRHTKGKFKGRGVTWSFKVVREGGGWTIVTRSGRFPASVSSKTIRWENKGGGNVTRMLLERDGNRCTGSFEGGHYDANGRKTDDIAGTYVGYRN